MKPSPSIAQLLIVEPKAEISALLEQVLKPAGYGVDKAVSIEIAEQAMNSKCYDLIMVNGQMQEKRGMDLAARVAEARPGLPILLFLEYETVEILRQAIHMGVRGCLSLPLKPDEILAAVESGLKQSNRFKEWMSGETRRATGELSRRIDDLETLNRLGQTVIRSLNVDDILRAIITAAVELTGAEEGSLLLPDESTGELYVRAARNFNEDFVNTFRLPIQDTLAGNVLRTGQPVRLDEKAPQKIKTSYLVHSLIYVPLKMDERVIGVLGVDNRYRQADFDAHDVAILTAMADYAVIAIENSRLYENMLSERQKLETILNKIQDGVIVLDHDRRLVLMNPAAQAAFLRTDIFVQTGMPASELFTNRELLELIDLDTRSLSNHVELAIEDGRIFAAQVTPVPEVGLAVTLNDITSLRKLDRIKNEFVSTVSHDLRSPLTAILGYVELIERAGPTTELQRDFIQRVQVSVQSITSLVDDLVNLGRIEAGFDTRKDFLNLPQMVRFAGETYRRAMEKKSITLNVEMPADLPPLFGTPVQIRQLLEHLLDNAIKYSNEGSSITMRAETEQDQIILQVSDCGWGIPVVDMPYIFDKFYRGANVSSQTSGTGLGLAIVKSIVESHKGRIWVDSVPEQGTTFTVVFPRE